ncbi:MAG TPA: transglycosylase SLT domain-containing protein, partial [Clostridia bacterium]
EMKTFLDIDIPNERLHGYLPYKDANQVYCSTDIIIGLQNCSSQVTQQTYEILASGGFLLTHHTSGVTGRFKPCKDLITSSTPEETLKLVEYYLANPKERKAISEQGKISVKDHMYSNRADYMLKALSEYGIIKENIVCNSERGEIYFYENYSTNKYQLHIVSPGDTLWKISNKYKVSLSELIKLNNLISSEILIDQVLKIKEITDPKPYLITISKSLDINNIPGGADAARWAKDIVTASEKYQIPSSLLYAVMIVESRGNPNLVSRAGGIGLMQLHIKSANWLNINPCDPLQSIDGAARYLKELYEEFHDWKLAVAAYNAGPDKVQKYNGIPPMEEPQIYVNRVFSFIEAISPELH